MRALADTSFIYALLDKKDSNHKPSRLYFATIEEELLVPTVIAPEVAYHLHQAGNNRAVAQSLRGLLEEPFTMVDPNLTDYQRALEILEKYADSRIDFVDACIMAMAERLNITRILTFDRRDFGMYRPSHVEHFEILP